MFLLMIIHDSSLASSHLPSAYTARCLEWYDLIRTPIDRKSVNMPQIWDKTVVCSPFPAFSSTILLISALNVLSNERIE